MGIINRGYARDGGREVAVGIHGQALHCNAVLLATDISSEKLHFQPVIDHEETIPSRKEV